MKLQDVILGQTYLCRVSGDLVPVVVEGILTSYNGGRKIRVTREGCPLPKLRSASALHDVPAVCEGRR